MVFFISVEIDEKTFGPKGVGIRNNLPGEFPFWFILLICTFVSMSDQNYTTYTIKLPQFEGPFDLLLFFIERDELDINNIPISNITDDFLAYIRQMEALNIDLASEFILVAATLMRIKAKMLLPRRQLDEEGNEIDPREELVQKLMEYKRYKEVIDEIRALEKSRSSKFSRGKHTTELKKIAEKALVDAELESITLFKLLKAFEKVMDRFQEKKNITHTILRYEYEIHDQITYIEGKIKPGIRTTFTEVFNGLENRIHAIVTFLALLEMLNQQKVHIISGEGVNQFWLTPA
jgi:segregation and condensation protein A